ncbi:glycosyltransferase [Microbacterium sp. Sa1CUA4]|uniref:Glycosyltransferase n=1 Tax=Microbacterium gallinarum TaxID=2762209 RepID=A0ABR8X4A7_9MICO|nr:glycosyltransferase [Microbacterium gallinarum]
MTVTYQDEEGLRRTLHSLDSLMRSARSRVECIVQDGGSSFDLGRIAEAYPWSQIESAPDDGIYNAMNSATLRAQGNHIWYLNGGDECLVDDYDELAACLVEGQMALFDFERVYQSRVERRLSREPSYIWHGLPTSHQSIVYPRLPDLRYRDIPIAADYDLTARLLTSGVGATVHHVPIARFHVGGLSTARSREIAHDAWRVQRDVLGVPFALRLVSRVRHFAARSVTSVKYSMSRRTP